MLYLKSANLEDIEKKYEFITNTPSNENGFTNFASGCSRKEFEIKILPGYINAEKGIDLADGWVPETDFFLWDDEKKSKMAFRNQRVFSVLNVAFDRCFFSSSIFLLEMLDE